MPVGFKNGTDGSLQIALEAMTSARSPHSFLGSDPEGVTSIVRTSGNRGLIGCMVESYLHQGNQPFPQNPAELCYGVSITDACVNWETTERMLRHAHEALRRAY